MANKTSGATGSKSGGKSPGKPSTTGNPSGKGRENNPPKKSK